MGLEFSKMLQNPARSKSQEQEKAEPIPMYRPASGERLCKAPSPPEAAMARSRAQNWSDTRVQPKLKVTPIRKALKNSLRFRPSLVGWSLFLELSQI